MSRVDTYFTSIDADRLIRARELSDIKVAYRGRENRSLQTIAAKSCAVLCYAHWEGFFNQCAEYFISFMVENNVKVRNVTWSLMPGILATDLQKLRDRNHSAKARVEFSDTLGAKIDCDFKDFDVKEIKAQSNLDFKRLNHVFDMLGCNIDRFQRHRLWIDRELCQIRHETAHGGTPDFSTFDADRHIETTEHLLSLMSDTFQVHILEMSEKI
jgi:hypothetical protein